MNARHTYRVAGNVQGVGFRIWALRYAESLGLAGYVRNLPDGSVETEAEGRPEDIVAFETALLRGPLHAVVSTVERLPAGNAPLPKPFEIRR